MRDFTDLYHKILEERPILSSFLVGHLAVEYLLRKLIHIYDPSLAKHADSLNHAKLIAINYDIGTIDDRVRGVLVDINKIRNKFAHDVTYEPTIGDLKKLFSASSLAFTDLTDGISQGLEAINVASHTSELEDWVVPELFIQISYDLHEEYHQRGGDIEEF